MSNNYRELTGREKQRIKKLITSLCATYDKNLRLRSEERRVGKEC